MQYSSRVVEQLVEELARLPGIGRKTAQRLAFHLLRTSRAVTAGDDHAHSGIETDQAADRLPRSLIGGRGHGTRVHDNQIRLFCRNQARPATRQLTLDDERVGLIDATPEGHNGKGLAHARAFWPISRRNCMPSNEMAEAAR